MQKTTVKKGINVPVRLKNPWFWVGLAGVMITAAGADPVMFTSWQAVGQAFKQLVTNPYQLAAVALAVLGVFVDPTTAGIGDSEQALQYRRPKGKEDKI